MIIYPRVKVTIREIFEDHWEQAKQELLPKYPKERQRTINEEVEKMLSCRTGKLGWAKYMCLRCGEERVVNFTCKGRFCTSCGKVYTDQWVERMVGQILDVSHRHFTFTISDKLWTLIWDYHEKLLKVMMDSAVQAMEEVIEEKHPGVKTGYLAMIHTFGRDNRYNPHVHILFPEGGMKGEEWEDIKFIPYDYLRRKWQYILLNAIRANIKASPEEKRIIDQCFKDHGKGFYVNGESKMTSARYAARYLGRYMARPSLAEHKITGYDGEMVTFWYEDHETGKPKVEKLKVMEFIKRLINHIVRKDFKKVRHYGLYGRRVRSRVRELVESSRRYVQKSFEFFRGLPARIGYRQRYMRSFGRDPLICPRCGEEMELWRIWHPRYGVIYDFCDRAHLGETASGKDPPKEKDVESEEIQIGYSIGGDGQVCLFPV